MKREITAFQMYERISTWNTQYVCVELRLQGNVMNFVVEIINTQTKMAYSDHQTR